MLVGFEHKTVPNKETGIHEKAGWHCCQDHLHNNYEGIRCSGSSGDDGSSRLLV